MYLFLYEGDRANTDMLIRQSLYQYAQSEGMTLEAEPVIKRTNNGKPYFDNIADVHFSVSHTGQMWVCLMADFEVGIDIQEMRKVKVKEITDKYFGPEEEHYVALWGDDGFMDLWVRKEALVKYLGSTLAKCLRYEVAENGDLMDQVTVDSKTAMLESIDMGDYVKCAYAAEKKEEICIAILN